MNHLHISNLKHGLPVPEEADIVIVGAGMSGLYNAWRIQNEYPDKKVIILEKLPRTGGRLDSDLIEFPHDVTVKEEEGGMRFTFSMKELISLIYEMGIQDQIVPFPMNSGGNNRLFF